ncbi:unannotated protein [freshwater metagenome]|uniref:Unannotated protein n=1 Tax=freshwater metagenome TaxID=449393 RepID=A0A6J7IUA4_9ZZZZ
MSRLDDVHKGTDVLIRALALARQTVAEARLIVIGEGRLRPALERLATDLGVRDAVEFLGRASDEERDRRLDTCAVFAMLSRVPPGEGGEGFGIVFAEAAARGVPVLAGDQGGARDAVDHGRTGLLVDPTSIGDAAAAIVRLLTDRALRTALGEEGPRWARRFSWDVVVEQVEDVLHEAARHR